MPQFAAASRSFYTSLWQHPLRCHENNHMLSFRHLIRTLNPILSYIQIYLTHDSNVAFEPRFLRRRLGVASLVDCGTLPLLQDVADRLQGCRCWQELARSCRTRTQNRSSSFCSWKRSTCYKIKARNVSSAETRILESKDYMYVQAYTQGIRIHYCNVMDSASAIHSLSLSLELL